MEKTVIDGLIDHSRAIFRYKLFLRSIERFIFALSRTPDYLPSTEAIKNHIQNIESEVRGRIAERNNVCKRMLTPLFNTKEYGFTDRFHFSSSELKDGYVLLQKNFINREVLFLNEIKDGNLKVNKGSVVEYEKCKHLLNEVKSVLKPSDYILTELNQKNQL